MKTHNRLIEIHFLFCIIFSADLKAQDVRKCEEIERKKFEEIESENVRRLSQQ